MAQPWSDKRGDAQRGRRRLTREQVALGRQPKINLSKLAREVGVSTQTIWKARQRLTYKDLP